VPGLIDTPQSIDLVLDPGIRSYVLIPIFLVVFLRSLLSNNIAKLVKPETKVSQKDKILHSQALRRSKRTRANSHWIPSSSFYQRRRYLNNTSLAQVQVNQPQPGEQNVDELSNMMSMMKGNTASYISNIGFMFWVNSFFSGFLLVRLPFNITETLRPLVQRDVALQPFDSSYVSSLSWYFISFFGLGGLNKLLLGQSHEDPDMKMMKDQMGGAGPMGMPGMGPAMPGMGGQYDPNPMFAQERNELKIINHNWACKDADKKLLSRWTQR